MYDRGVGSWIERRARLAPERPAVVHAGRRRSYRELAERVRCVGHGLRALGVEQGDRVGWVGANHPAFLEVLFATAKLGVVMAPVNHRLDRDTIGQILGLYSPTVVVMDRASADVPLPASTRARVVIEGSAGADIDYEELVDGSPDEPLDEDIELDEICVLPHTSGTTGVPKGVMLTHGNITWNAINVLSVVDVRSDDVTIAITPFFRTGGFGVNVLPVLFRGGTVVVPETTDPDEILRLIEHERVTVGFGNPDLLEAMTKSPLWTTANVSSIRCFLTGGTPVPEHLIHAYQERGITFLQGYGLSEAAPLVLLLDPENTLRKVGSAGRPPLFVDVRTVRPDLTACAPNETGELLVKGPNVMAGYWNQPDATRDTVDEHGWLRSGDAARIDDEGFTWIVDRIADAYQVLGHVVYPGDVERILMMHPAVVDAGVVPHAGSSKAYVVPAAPNTVDEHELLEHCQARLAAHEIPSSIVIVDHLPRSSVGKLLRRELALLAEDTPSEKL